MNKEEYLRGLSESPEFRAGLQLAERTAESTYWRSWAIQSCGGQRDLLVVIEYDYEVGI